MKQPGKETTREKVYRFIRDFFGKRGYAPTVRDILKGCAISSTAVVQHHLNVLQREGRIQRDATVFRSIRLTDPVGMTGVPLLGTIAAGAPIPVPQSDGWAAAALETIQIPEALTQDKPVFALRVKGTSMIDALIDDGDTVLMEATSTASDGDMVAVWLRNEQEVTLKRFFLENGQVCLRPANHQMLPMYHHPDNVEVQGRVTAVIRKL